MAIISNTSPILILAVVNQLHLLRDQFQEVIIPAGVHEELLPSSEYPGTVRIKRALIDQWLQVAELHEFRTAQALMLELDRGEAEAIALALELGYGHVLMDERDGRNKATALGLPPVGVLGVLLRAKTGGQIQSIRPIITALQRDAGFFIAPELLDALLRESGEG